MSLFLTAILPPPELGEQIEEMRLDIAERFKVTHALRSPVHITLYKPLNLAADSEKMLTRLLWEVSYRNSPFDLSLRNFSSFHNQTFFIDVEKSPELSALQGDISRAYKSKRLDAQGEKEGRSFHPHVTLAYRDVSPPVFAGLWEEFKNRKFKRSFVVENISVLKHDGSAWRPYQDFPLQKADPLVLFQ